MEFNINSYYLKVKNGDINRSRQFLISLGGGSEEKGKRELQHILHTKAGTTNLLSNSFTEDDIQANRERFMEPFNKEYSN